MSNNSIPANADNKVVAGENAKKLYVVIEVFYTSIAGREYGCEYIFSDGLCDSVWKGKGGI